MLGLNLITTLALGCLQQDQSGDGLVFVVEPLLADLAALTDPLPFPVERPLAEEIGHDGHAAEPGAVLSGQALLR